MMLEGRQIRYNKMITGKEIAQLVQTSCIGEVCAPKPGNVSRDHDFSDTSFEDFLISAVAVGPAFENAAEISVGEIIQQAVELTCRAVRSNTNLGMILLLAPLAKACIRAVEFNAIRPNLSAVLKTLTVNDAERAYAAIRMAKPGGMGRVSEADISQTPSIDLLQAMILAKNRDAIAREYATDFAITFETGVPALRKAIAQQGSFPDAIVQAFLAILSVVPDTLIARKMGYESACRVSEKAEVVLSRGGVFTEAGRTALAEFDRSLRNPAHTLNPGATADLTTAAIFLQLVSDKQNPFS
jgi:triphosphoribosyl-dephospho-CoA synthase